MTFLDLKQLFYAVSAAVAWCYIVYRIAVDRTLQEQEVSTVVKTIFGWIVMVGFCVVFWGGVYFALSQLMRKAVGG